VRERREAALSDHPLSVLFQTASYRCVDLLAADIPRVQRFLEENPEYDLAVEGRAPGESAGKEAVESLPPAEFSYGRKWMLGFEAGDGSLAAFADVIENLIAEGVWHIGLFIVATRLHGRGAAHEIMEGLERWTREKGGEWSRLGVVVGNERAERFWKRLGYVEVRKRLAIPMGERVNDVRVMVKPLQGGNLPDYLAIVARDRPENGLERK